MDDRNRARKPARGMTLIEILVVLVLLAVIMSVVAGNYLGRGEKAKADLYKLEVGRFPTTQEGLQALITAPSGVTNWNGPYWKKGTVPKDPWGNEYKYVSPAQNAPYEIISLGADGKEGGEGPNADLSSSKL